MLFRILCITICIRYDMPDGKTIFAQLLDVVPDYELKKCIDRYNGDKGCKKYNCRDQFKVMSFAQLTSRRSLRVTEATLHMLAPKLYHSGLKVMGKSTIAEMNESKPWLIYRDYAMFLVERARELCRDDRYRLDLDNMVYAFDSSTIHLCLSLCPWAKSHGDAGGVKLHTLLEVKSRIPTFVWLSEASINDVNGIDVMPVDAGSIYLMDKGYVDFWRLYNRIHLQGAFFVTRAKDNMVYEVVVSRPVDKTTGLISDEDIKLTGKMPSQDYPDRLRLVTYEDFATGNVYQFLTNLRTVDALTIAELYRERWHVELFFKWIKQHLRIKTFFGTSENAVFTQIWIAVCDYLLLLICHKNYHIEQDLYILSEAIGPVLFDEIPMSELFKQSKFLQERRKMDEYAWPELRFE